MTDDAALVEAMARACLPFMWLVPLDEYEQYSIDCARAALEAYRNFTQDDHK